MHAVSCVRLVLQSSRHREQSVRLVQIGSPEHLSVTIGSIAVSDREARETLSQDDE